MRRYLLIAITIAASLATGASTAQAIVVDMNALGPPSVSFSAANRDDYTGVALVPGTRSDLTAAAIPVVTSSAPCLDPALPADLLLAPNGLCSHGGAVIHGNETFAFTWDPIRRYWATTRNYLENFLSDVAKGSGTLTSPYAATSQYTDASGRAGNVSVYGGGCVDFGNVGGSACKFAGTDGSGAGHDYGPTSACPATGTNQFYEFPSGAFGSAPNDICLTDAQLKGEVGAMISEAGLPGRAKPGFTPLVVLLTPPGVVTCLDAAGTLCSANGAPPASFCSYHSKVNVGGSEFAYVVQPWTARTPCDESEIPPLPIPPTTEQMAIDAGSRMVNPLSQGHMGAIVNPGLSGWFGLGGAEINDNGCLPFGIKLDTETVGSGSYWLQREFNNAGAIESDPNALACTPWVNLKPTFVVPSAVNRGDIVQFDGSTSVSSLIVPKANYVWSFGDGTGAVGPSVVHSYGAGGVYPVKLTVTDRGGNVATVSETITVLGSGGQPPPPPPDRRPSTRMQVRIQLLPQGLHAILRDGVALRVRSNEPADGVSRLTIPRGAAKSAHLRTGHASSVVVGRGTVAGIKDGVVRLHLHLSRSVAAKLGHLRHLKLTVRLALVAASGDHTAIDAAGSY